VCVPDGFPERFNDAEDMLGYDRASPLLAEVGHRPAREIVERFVGEADAWANGRPLDDDMTFVVVKRIEGLPENGTSVSRISAA